MFCAFIGATFFLSAMFTSKQEGSEQSHNPIYNLSLVLRASRMLRLLWFIPSLRGMLWTIANLLPSLIELLTILLVPIYIFGCFGHTFFGDCMVADPAYYNHTLVPLPGRNVTYLAKWAPYQNMLQLDSSGRGILMMFEVATISSWNVFMDASAHLCSSNWAARLYFFLARIVLNMIFVPIIGGYLLDSFVQKFDYYEKLENDKEKKEKEDEAKENEKLAIERVRKDVGGDGGGNGSNGGGGGGGGGGETKNDVESGETKESKLGTEGRGKTEKKMQSSKYKTLSEQSFNGCTHKVQLKQRSPLDSKEMMENRMLGIDADKKAKKFIQMGIDNEMLKERIGFLEEATRTAKRGEMQLRSKNNKTQLQLTTLREEILKLRQQKILSKFTKK